MIFNTSTRTQEWVLFLKEMNELATAVDTSITDKFILCGMPTLYSNGKSKKLWLDAVKRDISIAQAKGLSTAEEGEIEFANWSMGMTIGGFLKANRSFGTLAIFTNALGDVIEQQAAEVTNWHTYAIFYRNGILGIYDPSLIPGVEVLDDCLGISLAHNLIRSLRGSKSNRTITEVWIGGGGNNGEECQEMTRNWVEHEVCVRGGHDLGNWGQRNGWVKLHF